MAFMKTTMLSLCLLLVAATANLSAQGKIDLQGADTIATVLQKNAGQTVDLRLKSGEKIGGKVEKVGDKLVHLTQRTGAEFYEAAVDIADISAVVIRARTK